jgi:hypothetical protein
MRRLSDDVAMASWEGGGILDVEESVGLIGVGKLC